MGLTSLALRTNLTIRRRFRCLGLGLRLSRLIETLPTLSAWPLRFENEPKLGVRFGRPRKITPHQRPEAIQRLAAGETQADVACTYNLDATKNGRLLGDRPFPGGASLAALQ
jgi:hypothetical protein